jgi:hypothetical protein
VLSGCNDAVPRRLTLALGDGNVAITTPKPTRLQLSASSLVIGCGSYLIDCLLSFSSHLNVPWIEAGIFAGGPFGFFLTVICVLVSIGYLIAHEIHRP